MNAFLTQADTVERCLQIERAVNDTTPELTCLSLSNDLQIVDGIGEGLSADLLGTMDERDARLFDAKGVTNVIHIVNLLATLALCWHGDNSCISEEEQFLILGNLSHRHMGEHVARTQDAVLLI